MTTNMTKKKVEATSDTGRFMKRVKAKLQTHPTVQSTNTYIDPGSQGLADFSSNVQLSYSKRTDTADGVFGNIDPKISSNSNQCSGRAEAAYAGNEYKSQGSEGTYNVSHVLLKFWRRLQKSSDGVTVATSRQWASNIGRPHFSQNGSQVASSVAAQDHSHRQSYTYGKELPSPKQAQSPVWTHTNLVFVPYVPPTASTDDTVPNRPFTDVCGVYSPEIVPPIPSHNRAVTNTRLFQCPRCGKSFTRRYTIKRHFPLCICRFGNPDSLSWTDHGSSADVKEYVPRRPNKRIREMRSTLHGGSAATTGSADTQIQSPGHGQLPNYPLGPPFSPSTAGNIIDAQPPWPIPASTYQYPAPGFASQQTAYSPASEYRAASAYEPIQAFGTGDT